MATEVFENVEIGQEYSFDLIFPGPEKEFKEIVGGIVLDKVSVGNKHYIVLNNQRAINCFFISKVINFSRQNSLDSAQ